MIKWLIVNSNGYFKNFFKSADGIINSGNRILNEIWNIITINLNIIKISFICCSYGGILA